MDEFNKSYGLKINFDINDLGEDTNKKKKKKLKRLGKFLIK